MGITTIETETATGSASETQASDVVQWFLDYYWIRHPVSQETLAAWRSDLQSLQKWLGGARKQTLMAAGRQDLRAFLDARYRLAGEAPNETPSLTCIKRFYFYLVEVGLRTDDPTERLYVRTPRLLRHNLQVISGKRN